MPIEGIDLPAATTIVMPIAHRTSVTIGLPHDGRGAGALPGRAAVGGGDGAWVGRLGGAGQPAGAARRGVTVERVVAGALRAAARRPPDAADDPVGYLLGVGELVRMGELADLDSLVPDVAAAVEVDRPLRRPGRRRRARCGGDGARARWGVTAPSVIWARSVSESETIRAQRRIAPRLWRVERRLARGPVLLPEGIPAAWVGADFEAHGLMAGPATDAVVRRALAR